FGGGGSPTSCGDGGNMKKGSPGTIATPALLLLAALAMFPLLFGGTEERAPAGPASAQEANTLGAWSFVAPYPGAPIESVSVCSAGTYAYGAGGLFFVASAVTNVFNRYDPVLNLWAPLAPLPAGLSDARAAYASNTNSIYVFGGWDGAAIKNTVYAYSLTTS